MKKVNKLELLCVLHGQHTATGNGSVRVVPNEDGEIWFSAEIWIDGVHMEPEHSVDLSELARGIQPRRKPYRCDFFVCGCGSAGCAAILDGMQVVHQGKYVYWSFRSPLAGAFGVRDEQHWLQNSSPRRMRFLRSQLDDQIRQYFELLREAAGSNLDKCQLSPHSETLAELTDWSAVKRYFSR